MRSAEENKLEKDLRKWFNKLQRKIQKLIDTYYEDELFFLHINKVYTIVEEMKPEYRAILLKHGLTQFYNARETTTTLYTIQQKKVSTKAGLYEPQLIREEDVGLFRTNPQIEDSLRYNTFKATDKTLNRVSENITNNLADSYHEGLGIKDAGRKINKEFAGLKGWEARRIARTEINSAQNEGAFSAYDELGVEYHMWWTGNDKRVRDSHRPLHGHIVAVGNTFSNGLLYPGDKSGAIKEWINCRCTTVPYILPLGMMAPPGLTEFTEDQLVDIPGYRPVTVEDALAGEYPLEYYTEGGVIDQYRKESPYQELKNAIADELKGFIPEEDIDFLASEFAKYKLQTDKLRFETMSAWDSEGHQILNNYTDYMDTRILHNPVEDIFEEKGFKLSIHNHPQGHSPIPSSIDVGKMLKTEYGLTATTDNGLIVMKLEKGDFNTNRISLRNSMDDFNRLLNKEFREAESKYYNRIKKAYQSNKITKQQKDLALNARYQKYLSRNVERYSKELNNELSDYGIRVKYISKDKLPKIGNYKQKQKYTILDNKNEPFKEAYGTIRFEENSSEKIRFTKREREEYHKLKAQKEAGTLKETSDIRKLREYEQQLQFNKIYEKYGNKLPSDAVDAKIYKNLAKLPHIKKKLGKTADELFKLQKNNSEFPHNIKSRKELEEDLKPYMKKKDSKRILDLFDEIVKDIDNPNREFGHARSNYNTLIKLEPVDDKHVDFPKDLKEKYKKEGVHSLGHTHPTDESPLGSSLDLGTYAEYGGKYGFSFNENGLFLVENHERELNKTRHLKIQKRVVEIEKQMERDYIKENFSSNKEASFFKESFKEQYDKELQNHVLKKS